MHKNQLTITSAVTQPWRSKFHLFILKSEYWNYMRCMNFKIMRQSQKQTVSLWSTDTNQKYGSWSAIVFKNWHIIVLYSHRFIYSVYDT